MGRPGVSPAARGPGWGEHGLAIAFFLAALAFGAGAWALGSVFYLRLGAEAAIFSFLGLSVDLLLGFTGLLSLGQALFFGLGAYCAGVLLKYYDSGFWTVVGVTLLLTLPVGIAAGLIAIRSRGVYFILLTFALAQVAAKAVDNIRGLGGSDGMIGIPVTHADFGLFRVDLGGAAGVYLLMLGAVAAVYAVLAYLMHTPFGRMLLAIRSNEHRVRFLGFDPWRYKLAAYVLAAEVAALGGAFYPMLRGFVAPELLYFDVSANALIAVVMGGVGSLIGALYGSAALIGLRSLVSSFTEHHQVVIGVLFMVSVIFLPRGFAGLFARRRAGDEPAG